ncbi:MAG: alpha/beta fold hydrolase [Akkermansiaceae bacterium]|nr:alpha/beta fold hydrolase [Akkermansiaceae bacterium]
MIRNSKLADERREAGPIECWCLHGSVGLAADWRATSEQLAERQISTRAVDLWRFLECDPMPLEQFGDAFNADASGQADRGQTRILVGYSMGGRLALHALLAENSPWQAAVIIGAHPGLEDGEERTRRAAADAQWASRALMGSWQDFLEAWDAQAILQGAEIRDGRERSRLQLRRREIARSFVDWSLGAQQPLWDRLPEIQVPVLWISGEQDDKFKALADRACSMLPAGKHQVAPSSGHRVPWQAGEWLVDRIAHFALTGR